MIKVQLNCLDLGFPVCIRRPGFCWVGAIAHISVESPTALEASNVDAINTSGMVYAARFSFIFALYCTRALLDLLCENYGSSTMLGPCALHGGGNLADLLVEPSPSRVSRTSEMDTLTHLAFRTMDRANGSERVPILEIMESMEASPTVQRFKWLHYQSKLHATDDVQVTVQYWKLHCESL
jgi:hypothetical protein